MTPTLLCLLLTLGQNDSAGADAPVARWSFGDTVVGSWTGPQKIAPTALRAPEFPNVRANNQSAYFGGKTYLTVKEADVPGNLRFTNGDSITLEAWVNPNAIKERQYLYVVSKGRTDNPGFGKENLNYGLRLAGIGKDARLSFMFRSQPEDGKPGEFHRWISRTGFLPNSGWHHIAVSYTFGDPRSISGFVDGRQVKGDWEEGGPTERPPVSDGDDLVIGSSKKGSQGNSFVGWIDEVAVYRNALSPSSVGNHAMRVPQTVKIDAKNFPSDHVRVELIEDGIPAETWPGELGLPNDSYRADAMGFFHVPHKYIDTGIRTDRGNPYMLRALTKIQLPAGKHRLLLRARGPSHLTLDGKLLLTTPFRPLLNDGHNPIPKHYLDLGPDFRFAPPGNRETWTTFESPGGTHLILLETLVGGRKGKLLFRPEIGETVAAIATEGSETFFLIAPKREVAYTDAGWKPYAEAQEARLAALEKERRAKALQTQASYWNARRAAGKDWLDATPEVVVPTLPNGYPAHNALDHFLAAKIEMHKQEATKIKGTVDFYQQIRPILEAKCFSCHQGQKVKGKLRLDSLAGMLKGGSSAEPALVPGQPDKSPLYTRVISTDEEDVMPPQGDKLSAGEIKLLKQWITEGAPWPSIAPQKLTLMPLADDLAFLRRVTLETVGVPPTLAEIEAFQNDARPEKRSRVIDRLLADPRWADHWVGYWQDVLAENPNILNPTLNNTGPFRWWIHEALLDDKPMDLFVTELLRMGGSAHAGAPAGFGLASQNDVPMAEKGIILASAFLGVPMKCARCHDAPAHRSLQKELFQIASMLKMEAIVVPKTSSVPKDKLHSSPGRKSLISVTLQPGTKVDPAWPFPHFANEQDLAKLLPPQASARDRLALYVTAPTNERFAQVIANRLWKRLMGRGIVEPIDDWEKGEPSHPELLRHLGRELVRSGYDLKSLARLILNSHAYQRAVDPELKEPSLLFTSPAKRRLEAEQVLDSLYLAVGKKLETEEVSLDIDSGRDMKNSISLGKPRRAWMLASTSNERDRPSLSLPRVQAVCDVLEAFGWRGSRQDPRSVRETADNVLQPAILANGTVMVWLTRLSEDHGFTQLALEATSPEELVDRLFLQVLTRKARPEERQALIEHLTPGFESRIVSLTVEPQKIVGKRPYPKYLSWSNHLSEEANLLKIVLEAESRRGPAATTRLTPAWRQRLEDAAWSLLNAPEFVFLP